MDDIDHQLIGLLRTNARESVANLAKALQVARGTVLNRMRKLERSGTIVGYTVRLRPGSAEKGIVALMNIAVAANRNESVLRELRGDPAVQALHTTNGRWDIVAEIKTDSLEAFDRVLRRIGQIDGVGHTETSLLLSTQK